MTALLPGFVAVKAATLFFLSFFSEDAATFGGAALAASGALATPIGFVACFLGIWMSDMMLYGLARRFGRPLLERRWVKRRVPAARVAKSEAWMQKRGLPILLVVRFVPGTRLPTYLASGLLAVPFGGFAAVTGFVAFLWVAVIFTLTREVGASAAAFMGHDITLWVSALAAAALIVLCLYNGRRIMGALHGPAAQRWLQWEFWPAWLFYIPVCVNYAWLGIKHRGFNLPTIANPGMYTGGFAGESKCATLLDLCRTSPEFTARSVLIAGGERMAQFERQMTALNLSLPVVLKPDIAQRGSGFKLVRHMDEARAYLAQVPADVVLQEYAAGPCEAGIFYYRFPHEARGRIFAITEKVFPVITGDGARTVEELIRADARAAIMAATYLKRHGAIAEKVLPQGQVLKLVEAGNHCQGCIFQDGMHLNTPALEAQIDAISRNVPGFFIGRYDVRYEKDADLMAGENFKILELNGAASEATSIYDARNSIFSAYATLFKQWDLVFAIGAANRANGHRPATMMLLWREWQKYKLRAACYPLAD